MTLGVGLIVVGVLAFAAPFAVGTWSLQFLSLPMLVVGTVDLYTTISIPELRPRLASYATGILAIGGALLLYVSPSLIPTGVVALLLVFLALDGVIKTGQALIGASASRTVSAVNGASNFLVALTGW
jgi:uncharacterized membrane protein HdeD (DUF308 family)